MTPSGKGAKPAAENMPTKNYRIDEATYARAMQRATEDASNLTTLIREWVADYASGAKRAGPGRPATVEVSRAELKKLADLVDNILK